MNVEHIRIKPKIAVVSLKNSYGYGGVLSSLKGMHNFLEKYFEPTVFFLSFDPSISTSLKKLKFSSDIRKINYFNMNCFELGARWSFWEPGHYKFNLNTWDKLLKGFKYFLAVSGTCIVAHPLALLDKNFGLLISTTYDEDREQRIQNLSWFRYLIDRAANKKMNSIEKFILNKANFIWALSNYSRTEFQKILNPLNKGIVCCGHPVDSVPKSNEINREDTTIISVGRFSDPRKNIGMLLSTFDKIYNRIPTSKLYIIGNKPDLFQIDEFSKSHSFQNVIFVGQVDSNQLNNFYQKASLMLITSYQEGFGISGVEALMHGIPIISTSCGGPLDFVKDDLTGYVVPINDANKMAELAISILTNQIKRNIMSLRAQAFAVENYSISKIEKIFKNGLVNMYPELNEIF